MKAGDKAPSFTKTAQSGETLSLDNLKGKWVVLYFYPADDTPGCTAEACSFRDSHEDFVDAGAVVIGVSADSLDKHEKFATKHNLPFPLISDDDGQLRSAYGVKKTLGIMPARVTYVIDPDGIVRKVFSSQIKPKKHIDEALAAIHGGQE